MSENRRIEIALEMCRTADAAHEAAAVLAYALCLAAKGAKPSDSRTGAAAINADAIFLPADMALEKLLLTSARLSQQVVSFQKASA